MSEDLLATELHIDRTDGALTINRVQDVEPILEHNKMLRDQTQKSDWGRHVAHVPNIFLEKWLKEEWDKGNVNLRLFSPEFDALIERKIKDPDYKFLRVDTPSAMVSGFMGFGS